MLIVVERADGNQNYVCKEYEFHPENVRSIEFSNGDWKINWIDPNASEAVLMRSVKFSRKDGPVESDVESNQVELIPFDHAILNSAPGKSQLIYEGETVPKTIRYYVMILIFPVVLTILGGALANFISG